MLNEPPPNRLFDRLGKILAPSTETVEVCLLCGSTDSAVLFESIDRLHHLPGRFRVLGCDNCSLVRLSPRPKKSELSFYYPEEEYYSYQESTERSDSGLSSRLRAWVRRLVFDSFGYKQDLSRFERLLCPIIVVFFRKRSTFGLGNRFPEYVKDGIALDIGCGSGIFLAHLKSLGWKVFGLEMSSRAQEVAKRAFDVDVYCLPLEEAPFAEESIDYIRLNHSLEHFPNPDTVLQKAYELLKPDGTLYVEVPNVNSFGARQAGRFWMHWDVPRHLFGFCPETLKNLLARAGFETYRCMTIMQDSVAWEETYKAEEFLGTKLADRPLKTIWVQARRVIRSVSSGFAHLWDSGSGDYVYCLATKRTEIERPLDREID